NLAAAPSFSGTAVSIVNSGSELDYPLTTNGQNLFDPTNGTIRFWYQPNWNSTDATAPAGVQFLYAQDHFGNYKWSLCGNRGTINGTNAVTLISLDTVDYPYEREATFSSGVGSGAAV